MFVCCRQLQNGIFVGAGGLHFTQKVVGSNPARAHSPFFFSVGVVSVRESIHDVYSLFSFIRVTSCMFLLMKEGRFTFVISFFFF